MSSVQNFDQDVDKELLQHGIKENANLELENNLNQLIHILGSDSAYDKIKEEFETIFKNVKTVIGNENKIIKLYKESKKKFQDLNNHCIKLTNSLNEERGGSYETQRKIKEKEPVVVKEDKQREQPAKVVELQVQEKIRDDIIDENELEQLNKEKMNLNLQLQQSFNTIALVEKDKNELTILKDQLEQKLKSFKDENLTLGEEKHLLARDKEMMDKKLKEWDQKYNQIKIHNDDQQKEIDTLKHTIGELTKKYEEQSHKVSANKNIIDNLSNEKYALEKKARLNENVYLLY